MTTIQDRVVADLLEHDAAQDRAEASFTAHEKQARWNLLEKMFGQDRHKVVDTKREISVFATVELMLDDPMLLGGAENVDAEDLANAIQAASKDWAWSMGGHELEREPEDRAHRWIWRMARKAAEAYLASPAAQHHIEDEVQRLEEDEADAETDRQIDQRQESNHHRE